MIHKLKTKWLLKKWQIFDVSYISLFASVLITIIVIFLIYTHSEQILIDRLRERLISITSTASLQFDSEDLAKIRDEDDLQTLAMQRILSQMNRIRNVNKNLRFIYIWRKTSDPNFLEFVADAEMLSPIDIDGNGEINGEEIPPVPGEKYDILQIPEAEDLFVKPLAQKKFIVDKWGTFLSGSAPIYDKHGNAVAVLGVDVEVSDFQKIITAFFAPFVILALLLLSCLVAQTLLLISVWRSRVKIILDLDRQKNELLSMVSHQLGKPVTAIKWNLESLLDGDAGVLSEQQRAEVTSLQLMATNMSDLVSMILDVSRIQMGKILLDPQPLDLGQFFQEILDISRSLAEHKGVRLECTIEPHDLPTVCLDRRYTRMVIENLMTNAIKYTPSGGSVTLRVCMEKGKLCCVVQDTGCGIPAKERDKIFGKMYRASNVRNEIEGNGFGLYIAKGAVEAQHGSLRFESEEGKGTTFYLELPVGEVSLADSANGCEKSLSEGGKRIS